jgi:hypothetical protein
VSDKTWRLTYTKSRRRPHELFETRNELIRRLLELLEGMTAYQRMEANVQIEQLVWVRQESLEQALL